MAGPIPGAIASVSVVVPSVGRERLAAVVAGALADPATTEVVVVAGAGRGPAAARQDGITRACGDLIVLLDDDVVPGPGLVSAHRDVHAGRERLLAVGPMPVARELRASSA